MFRKREAIRQTQWRRRQRVRRGRAFARRQSQERIMFLMMLALVSTNFHHCPENRVMWAKEREWPLVGHVVNATFTAQDWLHNFRMSHETFLYLCDKLRCTCTIAKSDTTMRKAVPAEQRVTMTLWFLSTGADYRTVGHLFGVSKSTVCIVTKLACNRVYRFNFSYPSIYTYRYAYWNSSEGGC